MVSMHTSPAALPGTGDAGGMNVAIASVASEIARHGVEVDLLTRSNGRSNTTELSPGVTLHELQAGPHGPVSKADLVSVTDAFGEAVADLAGRYQSQYDVIHAHYWLSGLATLPVALELGLPFVQSFHTVGAMKNATLAPGQQPEPEQRLKTETYLSHQASAVVAGSAAEATSLIEMAHAPAENIWVIPPGVDVSLFSPYRADAASLRIRALLAIPAGAPIIAVVGRVQPLKDQELAIRVLAELTALRPQAPAPVLVIVGEATPGEQGYAESLSSLAATLGVTTAVRFTDALSRDLIADVLAASTVTLVTSHSETFGLVALESAASGTPVIAFHGSGLVESVSDGVSGLLIDSRRARDWALIVNSLLDDTSGLRELSARARDYAEGYTWAATAAATLGLYASFPSRSTYGRP